MTVTLIIVTTTGMFLTQTLIFHSFPEAVKAILSCVPIAGVVVNFVLSWGILFFTGAGAVAGIGNILASILFGFYVIGYRKVKGIDVAIEWKGRSIFRYPTLCISKGQPEVIDVQAQEVAT